MSLEGNLPTLSYQVTSQSGGFEFVGVMLSGELLDSTLETTRGVVRLCLGKPVF